MARRETTVLLCLPVLGSVTLAPWSSGCLLVWDATCPDTFAISYRAQATSESGRVAESAEDRKAEKYRGLPASHSFTPVAIETLGALFFFFPSLAPQNTHSNPWVSERAVSAQLQELLRTLVAESTRYSVGVNKFFAFCCCYGVQPLPAKKETLVLFTVALSGSMAPSSIAAVGNLHRQMGYRVPTHNNLRLRLALRGAKRAHARAAHSAENQSRTGSSRNY